MKRRLVAPLVWTAGVLGSVGCMSLPRVGGQQIQLGEHTGANKKAHVLLLTDAVELTAGVAQDVELRFRVDPGFHINSHTPKDELLLPTALTLEPNETVKASVGQYPAGTPFRVEIGSGETLDVYQNEFRVRVRMSAARGSSTLVGALHYQACDSSACFPPRTLPVKVLVTAK